ncbi:hypothetical protein [Paucisalibacillus globulus]|uniref:hypothetical protein n=1 Tax=Paucisalibacillus globulus TaxID=351095 RepID=UPI000BB835E5|nr:hypothetical protein [Paucisalibacillus globulus]
MFKKDWLVIAVYRKQGKLKAYETIVKNSTKKQAINSVYDYLCWNKSGLKTGFRDVEKVFARKHTA